MTREMADMVRLAKEDLPRAAATLARAFDSYPMSTCYFPEDELRPRALEYFLSIAVYVCHRYGEIYAPSPEMEGVAGWLPPGSATSSIWRVLRAVPLRILFGFARSGGARMREVGSYLDTLHPKLAPFPHWYLQILGVAPEQQGKGFSSRLVRPMLERIDREGLPCYLETQDAKDVAIYTRFGFNVIHEGTIPGSGLTTWAMLRKPGGG